MSEKNKPGTGADDTDNAGAAPLTPFAPPGPSTPAATPRSSFHPDVPGRSGVAGGFGQNAQQSAGEAIEPNRLIIGREIKLKGGEISACDRLSLEGEVDNVNLAKAQLLEVAAVGTFRGKAHVDDAIIDGVFDGELTVNNRLTVSDGGRISGSVKYGSIIIEPGGSISGEMQTITDSGDS